MKAVRIICSLFAVCIVAVAFAADPSGTWKWTTSSPNGDIDTTLKLESKDGKLTGAYSNQFGDTAISNVSIQEEVIAFEVVRDFGGNKFIVKYRGKIEGDTIKGTIEAPGYDGGEALIPEGESADERVRRGIECFEDLARRHSGETVVAVTHGGILMGFFEYVFGLPFGSGAKFRRPHVALNLFTYSDGRWVLDTWGDVSHLTLENQDRPNQALQTTPVTRSEI